MDDKYYALLARDEENGEPRCLAGHYDSYDDAHAAADAYLNGSPGTHSCIVGVVRKVSEIINKTSVR